MTVLASEGLQAPNDLVVAPDGTIYFTDPPPHGGMQSPGGKGASGAMRRRASCDSMARGFKYDNGVALSPRDGC